MRQRAKQPRLRVIAPYSFCSPQVEQMSHPKRPKDPKGPLWRLRHNTAPFSQQGRAVAANSTCRWSHFAYAISWRTSSSVCASLISDRHRVASRGRSALATTQHIGAQPTSCAWLTTDEATSYTTTSRGVETTRAYDLFKRRLVSPSA